MLPGCFRETGAYRLELNGFTLPLEEPHMATDKISHHDVTVNGVKLQYVRQGAGEPLMLIHGWPGFWYKWHRNIGPLAEHFDVLVPDMRGFAYSDKPDVAPEAGYTDTHYAEDIKPFPSTAPSAWSPTCWPSSTVRTGRSRGQGAARGSV
jgi:alpha-beta hydrolase superfamily lysophospholipase